MLGRACARLTGSSRFLDQMRLPRINHDTWHLVTTRLAAVYGCTGLRNGSADRPPELHPSPEAAVEELLRMTEPRKEKPPFKDALK
jgi:hypothetical protein